VLLGQEQAFDIEQPDAVLLGLQAQDAVERFGGRGELALAVKVEGFLQGGIGASSGLGGV